MGRVVRVLIIKNTQKASLEICNFEYFPYHSRHFGCGNVLFESQQYTLYLLGEALKRNAIVILMRGRTFWEKQYLG